MNLQERARLCPARDKPRSDEPAAWSWLIFIA